MTGEISERQTTWLRGLRLARGWTVMCAYELGHPDVSELQSLGLVHVRHTDFAGVEWVITPKGKAFLAGLESHKPDEGTT